MADKDKDQETEQHKIDAAVKAALAEQQKQHDTELKAVREEASKSSVPVGASAAQREASAIANAENAIAARHRETPVITVGKVTVLEGVGVTSGPFTIEGEGFGGSGVSVTVNNQSTVVTAARDNRVKGKLPDGLARGIYDAVLKPAGGEDVNFKMRVG